jgi:hypothetical protein
MGRSHVCGWRRLLDRGYTKETGNRSATAISYFYNFVQLAFAMEDKNADPVIIWWYLRPVESVRREDDDQRENIGILICFNQGQFIFIGKYRVQTRYEILTYSATVLGR